MERRQFLKTVGVTAGAAGVAGTVPLGDRSDFTVEAADLGGEGVELLTDEYNVSHVYGEDLYALGYGQGYAQARDRLFQMDLLRSIGHGELSEVIGPAELPQDIANRRDLYTREELEEQWEEASEDVRQAIEGFSAGVNKRMGEAQARGEVPGEFVLLGRKLRPWEPIDTVAAITYMIGRFGVGGGADLDNLRSLGELFDRVAGRSGETPDIFESEADAWEAYGDTNSVEVPDHHYGSILASELEQTADGATPTRERALSYEELPEEQLALVDAAENTESWGVEESALDGPLDAVGVATGMFAGVGFGSNAIVVDGEHTETGSPMLGGGPQMGLFKPPVIHEIGLHGADYDVVGIGVVGTPGIVVGRTPNFAWTVTTSGDSMTERVAVDLDPEDHSRYRWDGEWHDFVTEEHVHEPNLWAGLVWGQVSPQSVEQEVAYVEQDGTKMPVRDYNPEEDVAFVERKATRMNELEGAFKWAEVGRADDREEFEESLSEFPFGFNFHLVDDEGIAYYRTGKLPRRGSESDPRLPTPQEYHGWDGFERGILVAERDPDRGYVVNWNNAPAPGWRNSDEAFSWDGAQRVEILDSLLKEAILDTDENYSLADVEGRELPPDASGSLALADVESIIAEASVEQPFAPRFVPHFVAAARASGDDQLHAMADELETWAEASDVGRWTEPSLERWAETEYSYRPGEDGHYPNGGMAIYEEIRHELTALAFEDTFGDEAPTLDFDPTGTGTTSSSHAAAHGTGGNSGMLLVDALEGRTTFEWIADYGSTFQVTNAASGQAMQLDTGAAWWEWLWAEDEVELADPAGRPSQRWTATADVEGHDRAGLDGSGADGGVLDGGPCRLESAATTQFLGLDGGAAERGARVTPTGDASQHFAFEQTGGEQTGGDTYRLRNPESGLVVQPTDGGDGLCQDVWTGQARQQWEVTFGQAGATRAELLQATMRGAAETLESRYGSEDPADWLLANRQSEFGPLGGTNSELIPITNRASYQQSIAIGEGEGSEAHRAKSVLPPSNIGHVDTWELISSQFGDDPDRLTTQLEMYSNHGYKPQPISRAAVEERAVQTTEHD